MILTTPVSCYIRHGLNIHDLLWTLSLSSLSLQVWPLRTMFPRSLLHFCNQVPRYTYVGCFEFHIYAYLNQGVICTLQSVVDISLCCESFIVQLVYCGFWPLFVSQPWFCLDSDITFCLCSDPFPVPLSLGCISDINVCLIFGLCLSSNCEVLMVPVCCSLSSIKKIPVNSSKISASYMITRAIKPTVTNQKSNPNLTWHDNMYRCSQCKSAYCCYTF